MPLLLNGLVVDAPPDIRTLFHTYPQYKETASALCALPPKVVGPVGLLYVNQREFAVTIPHDKNVSILGSDDATTCHIAVLRHSGSGAVCMAHFDGAGSLDEDILHMLRRIQELSLGYPEGRIQLHLIGGFEDSRRFSEELSVALLHSFHKQPVEIDLLTACLGELNTTIRGGIHWPIIYGIGVNVKTGEIFPATFSEKGPDAALRSARHFTGSHENPIDREAGNSRLSTVSVCCGLFI